MLYMVKKKAIQAGVCRALANVLEFEEMEERIRNEVYGAVDILLHAEEQLERSARLVACWERYVL
jgi:hypothetical protein